jgi:hypothetical protein
MSDKKISELTATSTINQSDVSVLVNGGVDYKFAFSTLLQFLSTNLTVGANITFGTILPQNTTGKNGDVFINTNSGSFAQKTSGTWAIVYTLPSISSLTDGTVLYGLGIPGASLGNNNDTYIDTGSGIFIKKQPAHGPRYSPCKQAHKALKGQPELMAQTALMDFLF